MRFMLGTFFIVGAFSKNADVLASLKERVNKTESDGFCYGENGWPRTEENSNAQRECGGSTQTRFCSFGGVWAAPTPCQCPGADSWPTTNAGDTALRQCFDGSEMMSRWCDTEGIWHPPTNVCHCYGENGWATAEQDTTSTQECPVGTTGQRTRYCTYGGQWGNESDNCA